MAQTEELSRFVEFGKKIVAIGNNYSEHAAELGNVVPTKPLIFLKPTSSYIEQGQKIKIPLGCVSMHHEVELGVVIGTKGTNIPENQAMDYVGGYVLALDMTARDFQEEAKKKGSPWSLAKGFDTSCPVSKFISKQQVSDPANLSLWLKVNGEVKQHGNTKDMVFNIESLVSYVSKYFTLEPGDLLLTGTPSGVGPVKEGDVIEAGLEDFVTMSFSVDEK